METVRPNKAEYYLAIAEVVSRRSTCLRRQYGAVLVSDDRIISTGYNGSARGDVNCCDTGECWREKNGIPHGERYELCRAVHAEMNAIINGDRSQYGFNTHLYLAGFENGNVIYEPEMCQMCMRVIKNAGIFRVITRKADGGYKIDFPQWM